MKQVPNWVMVVLIIAVAAVFIYPPMETQVDAGGGRAKMEFRGWHPVWAEPTMRTEGDFQGTPEVWQMKISYLIIETLVVCAIVLGLGVAVSKEGSKPVQPAGGDAGSPAPPTA